MKAKPTTSAASNARNGSNDINPNLLNSKLINPEKSEKLQGKCP